MTQFSSQNTSFKNFGWPFKHCSDDCFPFNLLFVAKTSCKIWPNFQFVKSLVPWASSVSDVDVLENDSEPVALKHGKWSPQVPSMGRLPFPNHFRMWTISLTPFLHFNLSSITEFHTHASDLLCIICFAVRACVCEKVFEVVCVSLLNQYLPHPFQAVGSVSISRPLFISPTFPKCLHWRPSPGCVPSGKRSSCGNPHGRDGTSRSASTRAGSRVHGARWPQTASTSWNFLFYQRWWRTPRHTHSITVCIYMCF